MRCDRQRLARRHRYRTSTRRSISLARRRFFRLWLSGFVVVVELGAIAAADRFEPDGISVNRVKSADRVDMCRPVAGPFCSGTSSDVRRILRDDEYDFMIFTQAAVGEVASEVHGVEMQRLQLAAGRHPGREDGSRQRSSQDRRCRTPDRPRMPPDRRRRRRPTRGVAVTCASALAPASVAPDDSPIGSSRAPAEAS
jgi:hypothetical protein